MMSFSFNSVVKTKVTDAKRGKAGVGCVDGGGNLTAIYLLSEWWMGTTPPDGLANRDCVFYG